MARKVFAIRLSDIERQALDDQAQGVGLTTGRYVRMRLGLETTPEVAEVQANLSRHGRATAVLDGQEFTIEPDGSLEFEMAGASGLLQIPEIGQTQGIAREIASHLVDLAAEPVEDAPDIVTGDGEMTLVPRSMPVEPKHRHKPKDLLRTEFDKGAKVEVWACTCGKEMPR